MGFVLGVCAWGLGVCAGSLCLGFVLGVCAWGLCWESVLGVWGVCLGMVDGGAVLPRGLTVLPFLAFITEL